MAVSSVAQQQRSPMRFRGRSYMAFALTPEPPIVDWLSELDLWIRSSAGFFVGRPVVLDLAAVTVIRPIRATATISIRLPMTSPLCSTPMMSRMRRWCRSRLAVARRCGISRGTAAAA